MSAPKPGPRLPTVDIPTLEAELTDILAHPTATLAEETEQLARAHALLADALQMKER